MCVKLECGKKKISKNVLKYNLNKLHYISKLNIVAHGVKSGVLELICTYGLDPPTPNNDSRKEE